MLNGGPGVGRPQLDETATAGTYVGQLDALSADAAETFTWTLLDDDSGRFELLNGNEIWTVADRFSWERQAVETISVRCTGSRGEHIDVDCPIAIVAVDDVGEDVINGAVVGVIGDDGKWPDGMVTQDQPANVEIEILELPLIGVMHCMKVKITCDLDSGGITPINTFWNNGPGRTGPAANGDVFDLQAFVARDPDDPVQTMSNAGISLTEHDASFAFIKSHTFSNGLTFDTGITDPLARLGDHAITLDGGGSVAGVSGAFYWEFPAGTGTLTQTLYICAAKCKQVSGAYMLDDPDIFDGHRAGASVGSNTLPTNWSQDAQNTTRTITAVTTVEDVQCFEFNVAATGANPRLTLFFEHGWTGSSIAAVVGDNIVAEICVQILEYTDGGVIEQALQIYELSSGDGYLGQHDEPFPWASANEPFIAGYRTLDIAMGQATAAKVTGAVYLKLASASATAKIRLAARLRNLG
jgi:hypothetical protein